MRITRTVAGRSRRVAVLATTGLTASALLLTGCSSDDSDSNESSDANGKITLTVADFGQFGYKEAGLFAKYHELHPNITVKEDTTADEKVYYPPKLLQQLNSGSGLADVQGLEVGRIKELVDTKADQFADLSKVIDVNEFVSWKEKQATTADGKVIGAGTDIGPMSLCYNTELFKKAGLPTDRKAVAAKISGGWEDYLKLGEEFKKKAPPAGTYFMDSASAMYNAVVSSNAKQYYDESGKAIYKDSPSVQQLEPRGRGRGQEADPGPRPVQRPVEGRAAQEHHGHRGLPRLDGRPDLRERR